MCTAICRDINRDRCREGTSGATIRESFVRTYHCITLYTACPALDRHEITRIRLRVLPVFDAANPRATNKANATKHNARLF